MTDDEQKRVFSKNLNYYISNSGKQQKEVAKDLFISPTTFNTWCVGKVMPGIGKVQKIADYFGIGKSDLLDDRSSERNPGLDYLILTDTDVQRLIEKYTALNNSHKEMLKSYLDFLLSVRSDIKE